MKSPVFQIGESVRKLLQSNESLIWVAAGGKDTIGGFSQTQGCRNYVGHFEEYLRWEQRAKDSERPVQVATMQRYVYNVAKAGLTLKKLLGNFDRYIQRYRPTIVSYHIGYEDILKGKEYLQEFQKELDEFLVRVLALEHRTCKVVIQMCHSTRDASFNALIAEYTRAVLSRVDRYKNEAMYESIVIVRHDELTDRECFKSTCLTDELHLNAYGHLEIGRQLSRATIGTAEHYPGKDVTLDLYNHCQTVQYVAIAPTVSSTEDGIYISLPEEFKSENWEYVLEIGNQTVQQKGIKNQAFIPKKLLVGDYRVKTKMSRGHIQLKTIWGSADSSESTVRQKQVPTCLERVFRSKESLNWLFMGDSITHGALWTFGYDSTPQIIEKYLHDVVGRREDVVLNTAVSGSTISETLSYFEQRFNRYQPDIVCLMLGTNDSQQISPDTYYNELKELLTLLRKRGSIVILRTLPPSLRYDHIIEYVYQIRKLAIQERVILIDHYDTFSALFYTYPYLWEEKYCIMSDSPPLHPGPNGHVMMARDILAELGLWEESLFSDTWYGEKLPIVEVDMGDLLLFHPQERVGVNIQQVEERLQTPIGSVSLSFVDKRGSRIRTVEQSQGTVWLNALDRDHVDTIQVEVRPRYKAMIYKGVTPFLFTTV
ncbi:MULTISPECIES: SGNH/GDSL hydrolase family protein [unclassified Streptococcus]|uniref:SGNH/GDSL hydrolase family protein n=1 Tax=unclassified Streptococcus TaxID=2608887 RepID=UPI0010720811|nr:MULTISPECIES: SGNH/GDSL hydrolase family protein [unclassified Streptococcus]MBF0787113.1 SGNH/GDSL hydrolase family protein [Streptococcus sp. 19428wC2_LYSM12]MCQ9211331.1 SGNH/GDSL hydrolase family protein [Streptococcus sp. B01]MCQ9214643.1 SGNH/GDSL hydrolase family protein [Streptococcus sp. O1]TFV05997.1 hypothetical protein E4T79_04285 [Streptococcus sp. LYSM12]